MHAQSSPRSLRAATRLLFAAAPLAVASAGWAQDVQNAQEPAATQELPDTTVLVGQTRVIQAPWPARGAAITDPTVADIQVLTPELVLVSGTGVGASDLVLWGEDGRHVTGRVEVRADLPRLEDQLAIVAPSAQLELSQSGAVLVVSGLLGSAEDALVLRRYLDTLGLAYVDATRLPGAAQVQVNVRVAEVSRTALRALGVNAFVTGSDAFLGSTIGSSSGGALNPVNIGPPEGSPANGNTNFVFNDAVDVSPLITLFGGSTDGDFEVFLQALEEEQYLHILAQPNLVALSGEEASFLAGGEFPIPVVQGGAAGTGTSITIEYKAFGIALAFRPVVLGNGLVRLSVTSEVSDISDIGAIEIEGFRVPSIVTRRADTTVEMRSGQTFAMAGLISEAVSSQVTRTPWLGEIPVLGSLFRSVRYRKGESELVVLVSIDLVEPLSSDALPPLPGSAHVAPTELEFYGQGMIEGPTPPHTALEQELWRGKLGLGRLRGPNGWAPYALPPGEAAGQAGNDD